MKEGFYLNGEYACCRECAIALYNGDEEAWKRDMEEEEYDPGSTECFYTEWYGEGEEEWEKEWTDSFEEVDSVVLMSCYRVRHHKLEFYPDQYTYIDAYFTQEEVASGRYEELSNVICFHHEEWILLERLDFEVREGELSKPKSTELCFCGRWRK